MSLPGDGQPDFKTVGLQALFGQMTEEFRPDVVRRALTSRDQVSEGARAALTRAVNAAVNVKGFRPGSAGIAPASILQKPVDDHVQFSDDLAGAVLRVWAESHQTLRDLVSAYLSSESLLDGEPDYSENTILIGQLDPRLSEATDRMIEAHPELSKDDLLLMSYYTSGRMPSDDAEDTESSPTVSAQSTGVFKQMLDTLRATPPDDPIWQEAFDVAEAVKGIREAKLAEVREAAELDSQVRAISGQYAGLLQFFEWNAEEKLEQRPHPWADVQAARQVISELNDLLGEYARVHPMADSLSAEEKRGPQRIKLQKQLVGVLDRFDVLEVQAPPAGPQGKELTPNRPGLDSPQPEEQQTAYEAQLETLRAENGRLMAANQSLVSSNRHLTEQASELESDLNENRNLAEMWRRSYQDLLKSQERTAAGDALPDFESVAQVVRLAEKRLTDRLSFPLNSKSDLEIPFDNPRQVWDALEWLATTYYQAKTGENGEPDFDLSLRHACGWRYAPDQADTTVGQYRDYYETRMGNRRRELREHIGTGNGYHRGTIRIAFAWDTNEKKVIVGYIGRHQRTDAS